MSSTDKSTSDKPAKQACNNCRRRKIKCNRADPCDKCQRLLLACSYSDVLRRKGPKIRTLYPLAPIHPQSSRPAGIPTSAHQGHPTEKDHSVTNNSCNNIQGRMSTPPSPAVAAPEPRYTMYDYSDPLSGLGPPELSSPDSTDSFHSDSSNYRSFPIGRRLTPPVLLAHVNVYLKYLFPIMPIVNRKQLQLDSHHPEQLSPQRYAFMAAMCAATHIQLKLDGTSSAPPDSSSQFQTSPDGQSAMSGEELLAEAVRARRDCDVVDGINIDSLLTSFFFFAAYGNLDMQDHAWFYLCQSITMAITMGLHRESTYSDFNLEEAENRRRVFWLLFITERAYALQHLKPVMLRSSIHKPQVMCSDDPILAYGFINLIGIFEKLTVNIYDWISTGGGGEAFDMPHVSAIQTNLAKPISVEGVLEIQQVDILVTQQWLQAMMWKLSMNQPGYRDEGVLPFHLPLSVGKTVMGVIAAVSQGAIDAHGIGMEQKLFDLGASVADVTRSLGPKALERLAELTVNPRELLWGILSSLSRIRGSQSYLFPALLERSHAVLDMHCPTMSVGSFLPTLGEPPSTTADNSLSSWSTGTTDEPGWSMGAVLENVVDQSDTTGGNSENHHSNEGDTNINTNANNNTTTTTATTNNNHNNHNNNHGVVVHHDMDLELDLIRHSVPRPDFTMERPRRQRVF